MTLTRQQRRAADRAAVKVEEASTPLDTVAIDTQHVVEPLRSELTAIVRRKLKAAGLEHLDIPFWVDVVSTAINERMDDHHAGISERSATPMRMSR